jgi:hypothetical protein
MNVRFFQVAEIELDDAVEYYNQERWGLGGREGLLSRARCGRRISSALT